jgi:hypothetical protein
LAFELTREYDNIYDKAVALEEYLRQIPYNEDIEAPPPDRDGVDYFLFDSREGYCDYYASAMAVMARAVGIPARIAVGYAGWEYDKESDGCLVRRSNAHAWVEIYFPDYGWIEFEPTAGEPRIMRPGEGVEVAEGDEERSRSEVTPRLREPPEDEGGFLPQTAPRGFLSVKPLLGVFFLLIPLAIGFALWLRGRRRQTLPVERVYRGMASYARLLGLQSSPSQTPLEFGASLAERVPMEGVKAVRISELYSQERFSREGISEAEGKEAREDWSRLRRAIWRCTARKVFLAIRSVGGLFGRAH